ncbi:MAG: efflux RND transporter periplasmic adaptor subunit [Paludibacteraceae bacterium]|nr:efflux RND transporter periplasmic adaptor subunit [Paludibacteraceae bacterium]OPZ02514.1 MAG: Antibiotic efflux pump periplasmic linker protein ArpA precursor [Bacteroidetes bacterium ADurb.BinA395]HOF99019.1 efflux RND transporter periplasmic adaptor subunit [Paludibacteraceae bacterium]HOR39583.1 efflux RND transporter periplasmic adaptor subunit [Paludibacteraceae bacterium]HPL76075.1 efflux RND transporter periplasmic adaptor subunit [Paludibacteraceae bacterium]
MKRINKLGILIMALTIGLVSCGKSGKKQQVEEEIPTVRVQQVKLQDVEQTGQFTATVQPEVKNNISPSTPGRIRKIMVEVGTSVSKGQKLVQMDAANLSNLEIQVENYQRMYNRVAELFSVGGASQQELDNAKLQLDIAKTNLQNLSENTYLLSPTAGVVTARNYDNGDIFNGQIPILTVMQINPVKLLINVSESNYAQVKIGMPATIKFDIFEGETFQGKISLIYPTIDERTRSFQVEIKMNNANYKIRPGMFARVEINFGSARRIIVPDMAVIKQSGSGEYFVYVYKDGSVIYQRVELGKRLGKEYEIISGLNDGDLVVVSSQSKLADGKKVNLQK